MKRILLAGLFGMMLTGQLDAQYIGTYYQLLRKGQLTGPERVEFALSKSKVDFEQPSLSWVGTSKPVPKGSSSAIQGVKLDRPGTMLKFDITKKMKGDGWEIRQATDENNEMKFTLCLDRKRFLPGGMEKETAPGFGGWGAEHTGNVVYMDDMVCFDLTFTKQ